MPPPERGTGPTHVARWDGSGVALAPVAVRPRMMLVGPETTSSEIGGGGSVTW
jgi:hypothetical protein